MKKIFFAIAAACCSLGSASLQAETLVYQAISDFPSIEDGVVPYYKDQANDRDALAINAGRPENRDLFARATAPFTGTGGNYDVTLDTLGEIDGECDFRLLVNGVIVGTATNARVNEDWGIQSHIFEDVAIPANAEISVESNAVTNGLIPEGAITAYARGRWRTLTMVSDDSTGAASDLAIRVSVDTGTPGQSGSAAYSIDIENTHETTIATSPVLSMELPAGLTLEPTSRCSTADNAVRCTLSEIAPGNLAQITLITSGNVTEASEIRFSVSADQSDITPADNTQTIQVSPQTHVTVTPTVDLRMELSADSLQATTGDIIVVTLSSTNDSNSVTATTPVAGAALPDAFSFVASSDCSINGSAVTCALAEITPGETRSSNFSVMAIRRGPATIFASVSSVENESVTANNEKSLEFTLTGDAIDPVDNNASTQSKTIVTSASGGSGGGAMSQPLPALLAIFLVAVNRRRRNPHNSRD
ncbi:hypothetical protein AB833_32145 [Chromatiales bacterium (ex Bugula neritina AB1)]|nr:hypothetical protein AB833_32145 [Chromatiales bacterium (ex Bugula neritina AB1)]